ncbi:MAG: glycosyltransferase family 2 protein, partial [Acidobacteria bacterium]
MAEVEARPLRAARPRLLQQRRRTHRTLAVVTVTIAFWASLVLVLYVYLGYPIFIAAWARMRPRPIARDERRPLPGVSVVIAARDEAGRIGARIDNLLSLDYPRDRLQLIVVSDGSTDRTLDVLARYSEAVQVVALPRCGKAAALNAGVAAARHDVVAFADARQRFAPDALRMLVRNFADERLGAVSGELLLSSPVSTGEHTVGEGLGLYWRYEKWIRRNESLAGSTVGATGAIYAMRKSLWQELPAGTLLDDVLAPMRAVLRGKRVVFEPAA